MKSFKKVEEITIATEDIVNGSKLNSANDKIEQKIDKVANPITSILFWILLILSLLTFILKTLLRIRNYFKWENAQNNLINTIVEETKKLSENNGIDDLKGRTKNIKTIEILVQLYNKLKQMKVSNSFFKKNDRNTFGDKL